MIQVDSERCTGCGDCVADCPAGAISLFDGRAVIDAGLCRDCGACVDTCPSGAISESSPPVATWPAPVVLPALAPAPAPSANMAAWRERLLPALAAAVAFAGRELLPLAINALVARVGSGQAVSRRGQRGGACQLEAHCRRHRGRFGGI